MTPDATHTCPYCERLTKENEALRSLLKRSCVPRWTLFPEQCWRDEEIDEAVRTNGELPGTAI